MSGGVRSTAMAMFSTLGWAGRNEILAKEKCSRSRNKVAEVVQQNLAKYEHDMQIGLSRKVIWKSLTIRGNDICTYLS